MKWTSKPPLGSQINWSHPLSRGLVACFLFNEGGSNRAYDLSGNANTGTLTGMALPPTATSGWNPGRTGVGLAFDGTNDYVVTSSGVALELKQQLTVSAWCRTAKAELYMNAVQRVDASTAYGYALGVNSSKPFFFLGATYAGNSIVGATTVNDNKWHHLVGIYDGTIAYIYVDGKLDNSGAKINYLDAADSENLEIGIDYVHSADKYWLGFIDDVRIYNRALSAQEVQESYVNPYGIFEFAPRWLGTQALIAARHSLRALLGRNIIYG